MNPYAAPVQGHMAGPGAAPSAPGQDFWRQGDVLVCRIGAHLPDLCLATGAPTGGNIVSKKLQWSPPWCGIAVAISPLIGLILILVLRKSGHLTYYLSQEAQAKRKKGIFIGLGILFASFAAIFLGAVAEVGALAVLGGVGFFVGLIMAIVMGVPYRVKKIDKEFIHLKLKPAYWASSGM